MVGHAKLLEIKEKKTKSVFLIQCLTFELQMKMSVKQESTTVMQTLFAKTLKDPLCAPASQGILGMELTAQVKTIPRSFNTSVFLINSIYLALKPSSATR